MIPGVYPRSYFTDDFGLDPDGKTYVEAIQQGEEVLNDMIAVFKREGKQLPPVKAYA